MQNLDSDLSAEIAERNLSFCKNVEHFRKEAPT